jgi:hypothetical protein
MFGKLFVQMYQGTLRTAGWQALITFQQLIILADQEGVADFSLAWLEGQTGIPLAILEEGVAILERPDPGSRTPDEEGRRIVRLSASRDWGWRIVNYAKYRALRTAEDRREYHKLYSRQRRGDTESDAKVVKVVRQQRQPTSTNSRSRSRSRSIQKSAGDLSVSPPAPVGPLVDRARAQLAEEHQTVFDQHVRASHNPEALAGSVLMLTERIPGATWHHVGEALLDLSLIGKPATGKLLLAFTRGAMTAPPVGKQADPFAARLREMESHD